ncbi:hypothetical protein BDR07DRAFT_1493260 [Suillus spraguei]|nr:hypothetical protein BDR07DRAFT_1493260 [Suillus spraguei]
MVPPWPFVVVLPWLFLMVPPWPFLVVPPWSFVVDPPWPFLMVPSWPFVVPSLALPHGPLLGPSSWSLLGPSSWSHPGSSLWPLCHPSCAIPSLLSFPVFFFILELHMDVLFLQDTTESQQPYINAARSGIHQICNTLLSGGKVTPQDIRFGLIAFHDHPPQEHGFNI